MKGGSNGLSGPYDRGVDAYGHGTNSAGRCAQLNTEPSAAPATCPNAVDRTGWYLTMPMPSVVAAAAVVGVTPPPLVTLPALVTLVVAAEVAQGVIHA